MLGDDVATKTVSRVILLLLQTVEAGIDGGSAVGKLIYLMFQLIEVGGLTGRCGRRGGIARSGAVVSLAERGGDCRGWGAVLCGEFSRVSILRVGGRCIGLGCIRACRALGHRWSCGRLGRGIWIR